MNYQRKTVFNKFNEASHYSIDHLEIGTKGPLKIQYRFVHLM